jgi:hypothetical protein
MSYILVTLANSKQPGNFMVLLPKAGDQVTNKPVKGNFIINALICMYEFGYSFSL